MHGDPGVTHPDSTGLDDFHLSDLTQLVMLRRMELKGSSAVGLGVEDEPLTTSQEASFEAVIIGSLV